MFSKAPVPSARATRAERSSRARETVSGLRRGTIPPVTSPSLRDFVARPTYISRHTMLSTLVIVLFVLWALGLVSGYTLGGFIHILVVVAIVVLALRIISGRKIA